MAVNIGAIVEVSIVSSVFDQLIMTVLHYAVTTAPAEQDALVSQQNLSTLLNESGTYDILTPYVAACSNDLTVNTLSVQYIYPTRYVRGGVATSFQGAIGTTCKSANYSAMIEKVSNLAGRKNRGAIHMPAVPQTEVTSGKLSNDQLTRYSTLSTALKAIVFETDGPGRWQPCILHRTRPLNGTYAPWTFTNFFKTVRVQRRRTVGLGK